MNRRSARTLGAILLGALCYTAAHAPLKQQDQYPKALTDFEVPIESLFAPGAYQACLDEGRRPDACAYMLRIDKRAYEPCGPNADAYTLNSSARGEPLRAFLACSTADYKLLEGLWDAHQRAKRQ